MMPRPTSNDDTATSHDDGTPRTFPPPVSDAVAQARAQLAVSVRRLIAGDTKPPARASSADSGWFGPSSATWVVHADIAMIVGGLRALLLQTLHPLAMAGVADHSDFRRHPLRRLHRTSHFIGTTTFGSTAQAEAALATVRAVHRHVVGIAPDGRPYDASDPHLVKWVHITEVDSFLAAHTRYGGTRLTDADRDRYVAEMAGIARRLGAEEDVPMDAASLRAALDAFQPELRVSRQTSEAVRFLLVPPLPTLARAPYSVVTAAAVDLLPQWARRMLWLPAPPFTTRVVVRPAATAMLATLRWALASPVEDVA